MGTGPFTKKRYDLELTPIINGYLVESSTEKGDMLLQEIDQFLTVASNNQQKEKETQYKKTITKFSRRYDISKINKICELDFNSPKWEEVGASCIECGGCVYNCPTCTCFDLLDTRFIDSEGIEQIKVWDTCLFSSFSRMSGGVNPRKNLGEKYRQRTLKKLNFTKSWYGCHHCVGCGRCIECCPGDIGIDIGILTMINFSINSQENKNRSKEDCI
jgi:ferredoxin